MMGEPEETLEIRDLATLKVMADSQRMEIVDLLRRKPATVKEIAEEIGVPPKSLYYHVNLLEKHGLIRVVETRLVSGIAEKRYRATAYLFQFIDAEPSPGMTRKRAAVDAVASMFAITEDEMRISIESQLVRTDDRQEDDQYPFLQWNLLDLSQDEALDLGRRLGALLDEFQGRQDGSSPRSPHRVLAVLFPTYRRGERPDVPDATSEESAHGS